MKGLGQLHNKHAENDLVCTVDKAQKCVRAAANAFKAEIQFHLPVVTVVKIDQFKM